MIYFGQQENSDFDKNRLKLCKEIESRFLDRMQNRQDRWDSEVFG